jgi:hypothetical protein
MAESMGLPRLDPLIVYKKAKSLDLIPDYKAGTHIWAAAEAYCSMVKGIKWTHLPLQNGVEYLGKWLLSRGCIAVGMNWTQNDYNPGFGNIIEGGGQIVGGHAVNIYGIHPKYQWKRYPFLGPFSKTREADCFCLENSNSKEKTYKVTMYRLQKDLTEMVGLIKTT